MAQLQAYEKQQSFQDIYFHAEKESNICLFKYNSVGIPYTATMPSSLPQEKLLTMMRPGNISSIPINYGANSPPTRG